MAPSSKFVRAAVVGALIVAAGICPLQAQPIAVPNHSFESQSASGFPFDTNPFLDSWQKIAEPSFYGPAFGNFGIPWYGTAGGFVNASVFNPAPYGNVLGAQAGYILMVPEVTLFQDFSTTPAFNARFEVGKSYNLAVALYAKSSFGPIPEGSTFELSLYYRDALNNKVKIGATSVIYTVATFPAVANPNLIDYQLNIPKVKGSDAWAGKHIGIELKSIIPIQMTSFANWDFDNVRLTAYRKQPREH